MAKVEPFKILICPKCHYKSSQKAHMDQHICQMVMKMKAKKSNPVLQQAACNKGKVERLKSFKSTSKLVRLNCSLCEFHTLDPKSLFKHGKMHILKSHFQCQLCSYSVDKKRRLVRHSKRDHSDKNQEIDPPQISKAELSKDHKAKSTDSRHSLKKAAVMRKEKRTRNQTRVLRKSFLKNTAPKVGSSMNIQFKKRRVGCPPPKPLSEIWKVTAMLPISTMELRGEQVDEGKEFDFQSATDYFTKLEEVFATFMDRPIRIEDLEELIHQCGKSVADLGPAELKFHKEIALVAGALFETYLSMEEESVFSTAQKLHSLKDQMEEMQNRVNISSKQIKWWYTRQVSLQREISELVTDKTKAEIEVHQLEIVALQLKLIAKTSASAQRAFEDAVDQARLSKNRVCFFQEELDTAEKQERDTVIQIEEVEEEYTQDSRSLSMLKEKVKNIETSLATGLASADSTKKMVQLEEAAEKQRRALFILQKDLVKFVALRKSM